MNTSKPTVSVLPSGVQVRLNSVSPSAIGLSAGAGGPTVSAVIVGAAYDWAFRSACPLLMMTNIHDDRRGGERRLSQAGLRSLVRHQCSAGRNAARLGAHEGTHRNADLVTRLRGWLGDAFTDLPAGRPGGVG